MVKCTFGFLKLGPVMTLCYLTALNLLIFIDRGAVSGLVAILKEDDGGLGLSDSEAGFLGSAFMFGYMIFSPIFAYNSQYVHPFSLMGIGLSIWTLAVLAAGLVNSYTLLVIARAFTGIGEASFVSLAPPCIIDNAPPSKKTLWLSIFYSCVAIGVAIGFVYGNFSANALNWHWTFRIEAIAMLPFILIAFIMYKDPSMAAVRKNNDQNSELLSESGATWTFKEQLVMLFKNPIFVFISLGYSAYTFTVGGLAFWGPDYVHDYYGVSKGASTIIMGGITIVCGLIGTLTGSYVADRRLKPYTDQHERGEMSEKELNYYRVKKSLSVLVCVTFTGVIMGMVSAAIKQIYVFVVFLGLSEFFLFM